jgi:hypothetical protein
MLIAVGITVEVEEMSEKPRCLKRRGFPFLAWAG